MTEEKPLAHDICLRKMHDAWNQAKKKYAQNPSIDADSIVWDCLDRVPLYLGVLAEMRLPGSTRSAVLRDAGALVAEIMTHELGSYFVMDLSILVEQI